MKVQKSIKIAESTKDWIGLKYYYFLLRNSLKRKTTWFITILFLFILSTFLIFVPIAMKTDPFSFWTNSIINPQMFMMYVGALLAAVLSISVFQDYIENGTELIITSKPITRFKITLVKFCVVFTLVVVFCLICTIFGPIIYACFDVSWSLCSSLILSIVLSNLSFLLLFTSIATLCSMSMSKVWIFIVNFSITLLMVIFSITARFAVESPAQIVLNDTRHQIGTYSIPNVDGKYTRVGSINKTYTSPEQFGDDYDFLYNMNPEDINPEDIAKYLGIVDNSYLQLRVHPSNNALYDNDSVRRFWDKSCDESKVGISNIFNFSQQFQHMNNSFGLQEEEKTAATFPFGADSFFDNKITGKSIFQNLPNSQDPSAPIFHVSLSGYDEAYSDGYGEVYDNTPYDEAAKIIEGNLLKLYGFIVPQMVDGSKIAFYGGKNADQVSSTMSLVDSIQVNAKIDNPIVARISNLSDNLNESKTRGGILKSDTIPTEAEKKLFKEMVQAFIYKDRNMDKLRNINDVNSNVDPIFPDYMTINYNDVDGRIPHNDSTYISDLFHFWLLRGAPSEFNNDIEWKPNPLGIENDAQLNYEMVKFKLWYYNNVFTNTGDVLPNNIVTNRKTKQPISSSSIEPNDSIYDYYKPWFGSETDQSIFAIGNGIQEGNPYFGNFIDYDKFKTLWVQGGQDLKDALNTYNTDPSQLNLALLIIQLYLFLGNKDLLSHITLTTGMTGEDGKGYYNSTLGGSFNTTSNGIDLLTYNTYTQALALKNSLNSSLEYYGYDHLGSHDSDHIIEWSEDFNRTNRNTSWINKGYVNMYSTAERTTFSYSADIKIPFYVISLCWLAFSIVAVGASFVFYYKKDIK